MPDLSNDPHVAADAGPSLPSGQDPLDWRSSEDSQHIVRFYENDEFLIESIASYLGGALGMGGAGILIASADHRSAIESAIRAFGLDVDAIKAAGRFVAEDAEAILARISFEGEPRQELFRATMAELAGPLFAYGPRLRAFGEMVALLAARGKGDAAARLEGFWHELTSEHRFSLYCAYPMQSFSDPSARKEFERICRSHTHVVPAESHMSLGDTVGEQLRSIALLQQKASVLEAEITDRMRAEETMREKSRMLEVLQRVAASLAKDDDLASVVQSVTDAGCELTGAAFGAFFYNVEAPEGESYMLYTLSGAPAEAFANFPMPRNTAIFAPTFRGEGTVRVADVTQDPRFGKNPPYNGMPAGHLAVRSYLAVPVTTQAGEVLGGLFFGNPRPDVFNEDDERMTEALAAQAAVAIENTGLRASLKREVQSLREAELNSRRLAAIVESSDDAIISKSLGGIIATWNAGAERVFGYTAEEAIGRHVTILFPPGHLDEETAIISRIRRGERIHHYETKRKRKDGAILDISLSVSPLYDADGKIVGASKIARDITQSKLDEAELKRTAAELEKSRNELEHRVEERTASLREAVAQMEELSYTVSHDLRAPLRAMYVHCNVLMDEYGEFLAQKPEAIASVQRIAENCGRLDKMIRDVLAYGRVARDQISLERVSLDKLVRETISHYPQLQTPDSVVHVAPLGDVMAHEPALVQILSNLLTNAVKFVPAGKVPEVWVWAEREEGRVKLWVEDNGIGIDPKYHHRLFAMFERIHPNLPFEGTGVGLAIVRKATERMGGQVGVISDGLNGSRFWIELPEASE